MWEKSNLSPNSTHHHQVPARKSVGSERASAVCYKAGVTGLWGTTCMYGTFRLTKQVLVFTQGVLDVGGLREHGGTQIPSRVSKEQLSCGWASSYNRRD